MVCLMLSKQINQLLKTKEIVNQSSDSSASPSGNITIDVTKNYSFGVKIKDYNNDSSEAKRGTFTLTE